MSLEEVRTKYRKEAMRRLMAIEHLRLGREGPLTKGFELPGSAQAKLAALAPGRADPYAAADTRLCAVLDRINNTVRIYIYIVCVYMLE